MDFFSKAKTGLIILIGLFVVIIDFRMFFMSVIADGLLVGLLIMVAWKVPDKKKQ